MITFQELIRRLSLFWEKQGCIIHQGYDMEVGAGTSNPATFLRCLGPEPYNAAYVEPCRRPTDGRYGTNPNRMQHYFQYQVILKPSPINIVDLYLQSLEAIGFNLNDHDMRFVHDDWENPTLGAWGLGWEVWMDGMEITQFTYFQAVGGQVLKPITGELTYGLERLAMYLQKVNHFTEIQWNEHLKYGDIYLQNEIEWSHYNFEHASVDMWSHNFNEFEKEAQKLMKRNLPIPAYDFVLKAGHAFNIMDARGAISVTERTGYIGRIRDLSKQIAEAYLKSREELKYPLLNRFPAPKDDTPHTPAADLAEDLKHFDPNQKDDFVLEIGSEELPATFVPIGAQNLEKAMRQLLEKENIPFKSIKTYGTPRRLAVYVQDLAKGKSAQSTEKRGPAVEQAFKADGTLTPAGEGFFRSLSKSPMTQNEIRATADGDVAIKSLKGVDYLFGSVKTEGRATAAILAEQLPQLIQNLDFPKKMRWGNLDATYARPIRWIVSLFGNHVVPFSFANISAGRESFGHRQLRPYAFALVKAQDYVNILKEHKVMVDIQERQKQIVRQLDDLEKELNAKVISREQVIPQVLNLVEWPQLTTATFDKNFLRVPKEVIISEMVEHQKYFPVAAQDGKLVNQFVITSNTNPTDQIREGNQRVLSARLSDGVFLYEQGLKQPLEKYNEKLKNVVFQKELGSVYDKVKRITAHAEHIQKALKIGNLANAKRAAELSKADLATEMVYEFPELQGIIGRYYALASKEAPAVAQAIDEQWMPRGENAPLPESDEGIVLSLADKIDNLVGCYVAGLKPTSSSDPYALRRQTLGIIKMLIKGKFNLQLMHIIDQAFDQFPKGLLANKAALMQEVEAFITNRVKTVFLDYGVSKDEIEAALSGGFTDIYDAYCKVQSLHQFRESNPKFPLLFEVYKRAKGQINQAGHNGFKFSESLLKEKAEIELSQVLINNQQAFEQALAKQDYDKAYDLIAQIQPSLAKLFDEVKILCDEKEIRENRVALLQKVFGLFGKLLDFSKIQ